MKNLLSTIFPKKILLIIAPSENLELDEVCEIGSSVIEFIGKESEDILFGMDIREELMDEVMVYFVE